MDHHAELIRGQTTHVLRSLRHVRSIQRVRTNCDIDKVRVLECELDCLVYACLPAVLLDLSAENHVCTELLRIVELLLMVSRSAYADVDNLGRIHVRVLIHLVEGRAARVEIVAEASVVVEMGVKVQNTDALRMALRNLTHNRKRNPVVSAESQRHRTRIEYCCDSLADLLEGEIIASVLASDISEVSNLQVVEGVEVKVRKEAGVAYGDGTNALRPLCGRRIAAYGAAALPRNTAHDEIESLEIFLALCDRKIQPRRNAAVDIVREKIRIIDGRFAVLHTDTSCICLLSLDEYASHQELIYTSLRKNKFCLILSPV